MASGKKLEAKEEKKKRGKRKRGQNRGNGMMDGMDGCAQLTQGLKGVQCNWGSGI